MKELMTNSIHISDRICVCWPQYGEDKEELIEEENGDIADLTEEEVKRFYKAVTVSVRRRMAISDPPTAEEEAKVKEESLAIIAAVLRTEDRNGRISAVRAFLAKADRITA